MMKLFVKIIILPLMLASFYFAQENDDMNSDCPPLFTRTTIRVSKIEITKIDVVDSIKYSFLPNFILSKDSLSKLFKFPEIARRAGVEGNVIVKIKIDPKGKVSDAKIIKGIGGGCEEAALDVLLKAKFYPAKIKNEAIASELNIWVNFAWAKGIDKPDYYFDEIIYRESGGGFYWTLRLIKSGKVTSIENSINTVEATVKKGEIPLGLYTKLNDFIISQCNYQNYNPRFYTGINSRYDPAISLYTKIGSTEKSVQAKGFDSMPIGFWALTKLILYVKDQIKWAEVDE